MDDFNTEKPSKFHFIAALRECSCWATFKTEAGLFDHIDGLTKSDPQGSLFDDAQIIKCKFEKVFK